MKFEAKWIKLIALATSLPSSILFLAYLSYRLVQENIVSAWLGYGLFFFVVADLIFLIVYYAYKNKGKV